MWVSESTWKALSNGVGPFTLQLIAWKWQGCKDNYDAISAKTEFGAPIRVKYKVMHVWKKLVSLFADTYGILSLKIWMQNL